MNNAATNPAAAPPPGGRRAALVFIFITLLIDILSFGLIIPVLPHLIKNFVGGDTSLAAWWYMAFAVVFMAMQFLFTPIQGALADRFGRRPIILASNLGLGLDFLMMALVNTLPLLFIGRVISGITSASFSASNAYVADVTPPEKRAQAFGVLGIAFGVGFTVAPVIGGFLGTLHPRLPFWTAVIMCLTNFCYGLFVLPESLTPNKRSARFDWAHANPFGALKLLRRYPQVLGLLAVVALIALVHMVYPTTFVLYADYRFGWGPDMVGITLGLVGILSIAVQGGLIKPIVGKLGERRALLFGLACGTLGLTLYALAPTGYWFWAAMPISALWGLAQPAAQAMMSHLVDPREQGRLQGAVASVSSISGIVGAFLFPATLAMVSGAHDHGIWAGATFFIAAAILGGALLVGWYISAHLPTAVTAATKLEPGPDITEEIAANTSDLRPPVRESEARP
ncbi:TCR/Tet family MFS transporter [Rudaea sp.]|uniref:TCR/Tet family MFS transporter n=1 Tax=Rudaea sp. TaxID=2136325 RepID=UPI002ED5425D